MSKNNREDLPLQAVPFLQNCEEICDQESEAISGGNETKCGAKKTIESIKEELKKLKELNAKNPSNGKNQPVQQTAHAFHIQTAK